MRNGRVRSPRNGSSPHDARMACMDLELSVLNPDEADAAMAVVKESFEASGKDPVKGMCPHCGHVADPK
jgi:TPP-dependent indolepyruvate ferredoxin oxidoreductase alpha subunit